MERMETDQLGFWEQPDEEAEPAGKWHVSYGRITKRLIDLYRLCGLIMDPNGEEGGRDQFLAHLAAYGDGPVQKYLIPKAIAYPGTLWSREDRDRLVEIFGDSITNRDNRPPRKYLAYVVWGWLGEDLVAELWTARGVKYERLGCDWPRQLLGLSDLHSQPDFLVTLGSGHEGYIEIHQDHTGHYEREGNFHLRPGILEALTHAAEGWPRRAAGVIGLDVLAGRYFKIPISEILKIGPVYIEQHPGFGYRPAYEIRIREPWGSSEDDWDWLVEWKDAREV